MSLALKKDYIKFGEGIIKDLVKFINEQRNVDDVRIIDYAFRCKHVTD